MSEPAIPGVSPQTYVTYRCNRWGVYVRWRARVGMREQKPKNVRSWWGPVVLDGNVEQLGVKGANDVCPVDLEEAIETGRCVMALPEALRDAIVQEHAVGGRQSEKADALKIDRVTFWRRCESAYPKLLELMNLAAAGLPLE